MGFDVDDNKKDGPRDLWDTKKQNERNAVKPEKDGKRGRKAAPKQTSARPGSGSNWEVADGLGGGSGWAGEESPGGGSSRETSGSSGNGSSWAGADSSGSGSSWETSGSSGSGSSWEASGSSGGGSGWDVADKPGGGSRRAAADSPGSTVRSEAWDVPEKDKRLEKAGKARTAGRTGNRGRRSSGKAFFAVLLIWIAIVLLTISNNAKKQAEAEKARTPMIQNQAYVLSLLKTTPYPEGMAYASHETQPYVEPYYIELHLTGNTDTTMQDYVTSIMFISKALSGEKSISIKIVEDDTGKEYMLAS